MLVHSQHCTPSILSPHSLFPQHHFPEPTYISLIGERHCESKVSCPRIQYNSSQLSYDLGVTQARFQHYLAAVPRMYMSFEVEH